PDAMLQLAQMCEFTAKDAEAKTWYAKLTELAPTSAQAAKARGAIKRLTSVGQPLDLSGPALIGGKRFHIRDLKDKIVIVYYWASWNSSCRGDLAKLKALRNAYGDRGLELVCVNLDERAGDATQFLLHTPVEAVHLHDKGGFDSPLATDYGVIALPTTVL